eukprot:gene25760-11422_t
MAHGQGTQQPPSRPPLSEGTAWPCPGQHADRTSVHGQVQAILYSPIGTLWKDVKGPWAGPMPCQWVVAVGRLRLIGSGWRGVASIDSWPGHLLTSGQPRVTCWLTQLRARLQHFTTLIRPEGAPRARAAGAVAPELGAWLSGTDTWPTKPAAVQQPSSYSPPSDRSGSYYAKHPRPGYLVPTLGKRLMQKCSNLAAIAHPQAGLAAPLPTIPGLAIWHLLGQGLQQGHSNLAAIAHPQTEVEANSPTIPGLVIWHRHLAKDSRRAAET